MPTSPLYFGDFDDNGVLRIDLPHRIGHVEIRTTDVNGPTGYPVIGVEVVSATRHTPAADGRLYRPQFDHDCGVVLVGEPGPALREQERFAQRMADVLKAHDSGDHSSCPSICPAVTAPGESS